YLARTGALLPRPAAVTPGEAWLALPGGLAWSLHRGETDPTLGWYSGSFGRRVLATTLLGRGRSVSGEPLCTRLDFIDGGTTANRSFTSSVVSWSVSDPPLGGEAERHGETG